LSLRQLEGIADPASTLSVNDAYLVRMHVQEGGPSEEPHREPHNGTTGSCAVQGKVQRVAGMHQGSELVGCQRAARTPHPVARGRDQTGCRLATGLDDLDLRTCCCLPGIALCSGCRGLGDGLVSAGGGWALARPITQRWRDIR